MEKLLVKADQKVPMAPKVPVYLFLKRIDSFKPSQFWIQVAVIQPRKRKEKLVADLKCNRCKKVPHISIYTSQFKLEILIVFLLVCLFFNRNSSTENPSWNTEARVTRYRKPSLCYLCNLSPLTNVEEGDQEGKCLSATNANPARKYEPTFCI